MKVYLLYFRGDDYYDQDQLIMASLIEDPLFKEKARLETMSELGKHIIDVTREFDKENPMVAKGHDWKERWTQRASDLEKHIRATVNMDADKTTNDYTGRIGEYHISSMELAE